MGKKKAKNRASKLTPEEEAAAAEAAAAEAELQAEIAALGGAAAVERVLAETAEQDEDGDQNGEEAGNGIDHSSGIGAVARGVPGATGFCNKAAIEAKLEDLHIDLPFVQTLSVVSPFAMKDVLGKHDVHDDLKRETAFYQQALGAVAKARQILDAKSIKYLRPEDYYAEMVKSDSHMQRIRDSLLFEQKKMKAFEQRKRNQQQKKFGKQLRAEKERTKAAEKRATLEALKQIRKRRGQNNEAADSGFDVQLQHETQRQQDRMEQRRFGNGKSKRRMAKDARYGFGGGGRKGGRAKRNNADSFNDISSYRRGGGSGKAGGAGNYGRGGGGGGGKRGATGGGATKNRPGKKRRLQRRNRA